MVGPRLAAQTIIDSFQVNQATLSGAGGSAQTGSSGSMVGGERDLRVSVVSGSISAGASLGVLKVSAGVGANGSVEAVWDGVDNDPSNINTLGLGGLNLTSGGADAFLIGLNSLSGSPSLTLSVYAGANLSTVTLSGLTVSTLPQVLRIPYNTFSGSANFSGAGAIGLQVAGTGSFGADIDFVRTGSSTASLPDVTLTDLVLVDNDGDGKPSAGDTLRYVIRVSNNTGSPLNNVSVSVPTPAHTTTGTVSVSPLARSESPSGNSAPGDSWHTALGTALNVPAGTGLLANDFLGSPTATIASFGGGSFGGSVTDHAAGGSATASGVGTLTVNANGSLIFTPVATFTGLLTFQYRLANSGGTSDATSSLAVGIRPAGASDSYSVTGNTMIDSSLVPQNVLSNDTGDRIAVTGNTAPANGTVVFNNATGHFTYVPNAGYTGADSFTYTLANGFGPVTATVNLTVANKLWYIDNSAVSAGDGRSSSPFNSLSQFNTANTGASGKPGASDLVFLRQGGGTYQNDVNSGAAITLVNGQQLVGDGWSGTFSAAFGFSLVAGSATAAGTAVPTFTGTDPVIANAGTSGDGIALASGNTIRGVTTGNTPNGSGFSGTTVGTFIIEDCSKNGTGGAIKISTSGTAGTVTFANFNTLTSSSAPADAVSLTSVGGTLTATGGSITAPVGVAVKVMGGAGSFSYGGSLTKNTSGRVVDIESKTGGTVALSGAISQSAATGTGIFLSSNTGATVNFSGTIALSTSANAAFTATGGGTVSSSDSSSTITTTTGVGVNIANTTIGAGGITFLCVNVTGAANGIVLNNTGSGAFTVTGGGASDSSDTTQGRTTAKLGGGTLTLGAGGTITNTTGAAVSLTSATNVTLRNMVLTTKTASVNDGRNGISVTNTSNLSLDNLSITGIPDNCGIKGTNVAGLSLQHCTIGNNATASGTQNLVWNVRFANLTGTATVNNCRFDTSRENVWGILESGSATLALNVTNSLFQNALVAGISKDGLSISSTGSANVSATLSGCTFLHIYGNGFQYSGDSSSGGGLMNIVNSTFDDDGTSINISHQGTGKDLQLSIKNNNIRHTGTAPGVPRNNLDAIYVQLGSLGDANTVLEGYITGNLIGSADLVSSGSFTSSGIHIEGQGTGTVTMVVSGNTVRQTTSQDSMFLSGYRSGTATGAPTMNLTVTGNTFIDDGTGNGVAGLQVQQGTAGGNGDSPTLVLNLTGNANFTGDSGYSGLYYAMSAASGDSPTLKLVGYSGAQNDDTAVRTFLSSTSVATVNTPGAIFARSNLGGANVSSTLTCPTPSFTPP